ncbi:TlpA family protein disulfide reductase [Pedobacter sp. GSP4]|uniref:TlpA family protein disulfide reductase n=1 Tax=Pedobacter sp. GSP4 TaxID=3453716 RepID=UPI003EE88141
MAHYLQKSKWRLLIVAIFSIWLPTRSLAQHRFKLKVTFENKNLDGIFSILDDNQFIEISKKNILFQNGSTQITGTLINPSAFARIGFVEAGKYKSIDFVVDSGENILSIGYEKNQKVLTLLNYNTKSNDIFNKLNELKITAYRNGTAERMGTFKMYLAFIESYPNDFFSILALYQASHYNRSVAYSTLILNSLKAFNEKLQASSLGQKILTENNNLIKSIESSSSNHKVKIFKVNDERDQPFTNLNLSNQNYLIVFSATWCIPCQKQLPLLKKIYTKYKPGGLEVVYFNFDNDITRWKRHIVDNKLNWINVSERLKVSDSKINKLFGISAYPSCILVNKQGIIIYNSDQEDPGLVKLDQAIETAISSR